jgi:uncharacterized protein (DUF362 family)
MVNGALGAALGAKALLTYNESFWRAETFVAKSSSYGSDLKTKVQEGLAELGFGRSRLLGKSVLLKPNLVEPDRSSPHINTHPKLVHAVAEVFRSWDAADVIVGEGAGHVRDTQLVLQESGMAEMLSDAGIPFVDLNHDDVAKVPNRLGLTSLRELYLPKSLLRADLVVSMPKMKTHHWAGFTLSMKNLFGVMPGICYGWPKNRLHYEGIFESILDITATVRPQLAIVDGVIGMEGDGPIMGTPKHAGALVVGTNLPAVDATSVRLMGHDPSRIPYLEYASGRLGPIAESHIQQRGEGLASLKTRFELLDHPAIAPFEG